MEHFQIKWGLVYVSSWCAHVLQQTLEKNKENLSTVSYKGVSDETMLSVHIFQKYCTLDPRMFRRACQIGLSTLHSEQVHVLFLTHTYCPVISNLTKLYLCKIRSLYFDFFLVMRKYSSKYIVSVWYSFFQPKLNKLWKSAQTTIFFMDFEFSVGP